MTLPIIQKIKLNNFSWIDISRSSLEEMEYLKKNFDFHPVHLNDCFSSIQRPKFDLTSDYAFLVLIFPIYNRKTRKIVSSEIDFFIGRDYLLTVHRGELLPLINFFNLCQVDQTEKEKYFTGDSAALIHGILQRLFSHCVPILDYFNLSIGNIEELIFKGYEKKMVKEILLAKINIVNFRRIMQSHRAVISQLLKKNNLFIKTDDLKLYFDEILETNGDIWNVLENLKQNIEAIENTNNSLISFELNDIIKILTIVSFLILPITLIANIFGMNLKFMPLINSPISFWAIIGLMIAVLVSLIFYFKKRNWL